MSAAQVTEEHIYTAAKVGKAYVAGEDAQAAQLIADSEARARCEIAMVAAESADRNVSLRLQNAELRAVFPRILAALGNGACCAPDVSVEFIKAIPNEVAEVVAQLRAEVERLTAACDKFSNDEITQGDWKARAVCAEASLHALRLVCGTTDANKFSTWVDRSNAKAEKAEAELAVEREKVRVLRSAMKVIASGDNYMEQYFDPCQLASSALAATEETK